MTERVGRIDPELAEALAVALDGQSCLYDLRDLPAARSKLAQFAAAATASSPDDPSVSVELLEAARPDAKGIPIRLFRPDVSGPLPALLWFHGGGQVMGYAAQEDAYLKRLASEAKCVVAAVDYRLAPEARAPAAAEDGRAAYVWIHANADALGLRPDRIGIAGASGGGGIAAAVALLIRDRGDFPPWFLSLNYPMLDDRNETASSREMTDIGIWDRATNIRAWDMILGPHEEGDVSPYAAPGRETDLSGLPPTFLALAELDVFRDEGLSFATRLIAGGVRVELHLYAGAYHGWDGIAPTSALADEFFGAWFGFLSRRFAAQH